MIVSIVLVLFCAGFVHPVAQTVGFLGSIAHVYYVSRINMSES